jgi:teichuronic acid biosynthesis glycosyltransferase TuaC
MDAPVETVRSVRLRVLMISAVWPTPSQPGLGPFITRQVDSLRKEGIEVTVFPLNGNKNPWNYVRAQREVAGLVKGGNFDLVHAQWGQSGLVALPKKVPLVVTFRGSDVDGIAGHRWAGKALIVASRIVASMADQAIVVSRHMTSSLPRRDYHVIPSGLDLGLFKPMPMSEARERLGLDPHRRYVLFAASPTNPVKRHSLAAEVIASLRGAHDVELLVASQCPFREMPLFMNACDALLVTSLHEGSPNVVKEALACNLPVVSVNVGDVEERLGSVEGCAVCEKDDPKSLAFALDQVLKSGQRVLGRNSIMHLDETRLVRELIGVYSQTLGRS